MAILNLTGTITGLDGVQTPCTLTGTIAMQSVPPVSGEVLYVPAPHNVWASASQVNVYGSLWWPESPELPYSLQVSTNTDKPIIRCEIHNGELWSGANGGNDTERCELDSVTHYPKGVDLWFACSVMVEPGPPQIATAGGFPGGPLAWGALMQIHGDGNEAAVPWALSFVGETLSVRTQHIPNQTETVHWTMPASSFHRGQIYNVVTRIKITGTTSSTMTCWVDGVQVCNVTGIAIGGPDPNNYPKCGIYRGWQLDGYPPLVVYHANIAHGATSLLPRVSSRPSWPVVV